MHDNDSADVAPPIRVLVVDDHPVVRAGLRAVLDASAQVSVVGEAADATGGEQIARETGPQLVLMDLSLGHGLDGIAAIGLLTRLPKPPKIVVLTTYDTDADVIAALDAGAIGYLLKDSPPDDLVRAIVAAARGETVLAPQVAAVLVRRVSGAPGGRGRRPARIRGRLRRDPRRTTDRRSAWPRCSDGTLPTSGFAPAERPAAGYVLGAVESTRQTEQVAELGRNNVN